MFLGVGFQEIMIVLIIGIVVFGAIKVPKVARSLGSTLRGYRKVKDTIKNPINIDKWLEEEPGKKHQPKQPYGGNRPPEGYGPGPSGQAPQWGYQSQWQPPQGEQYYGPQYPGDPGPTPQDPQSPPADRRG
ncbi:MAG: twin-arginine translocase TatA/TatE family subunit [Spirochaetes bacterium]|nr:twin-arginine translocase TatA/TatE family subunit [Spirochaetota bacterium]